MDLFQRHNRVSVDSFVNPVEAQLDYAKGVSSTPTVSTLSRQPFETTTSLSVDTQHNVEYSCSTSSCDYNINRVESQPSRAHVQVEEVSGDAQAVKLDEPLVQLISSAATCEVQKCEEKEDNSILKFLATEATQYEEDCFGGGHHGKLTGMDSSGIPLKEVVGRGSKKYTLVNNRTCNSRGYKSLSLLCENFIKLYGNHSNEEFFVDEVAEVLNVGRRRIYDIVNVLESIGIVVKKKRNHYKWQGVDRIPFTLVALKVSSEVGNVSKQQNSCSVDNLESPTCSSDDGSISSPKDEDSERETELYLHRNDQNDKFLGVLTQRFIKLFLESSESVISFQEITRLLLGEQDKDMKSKTGVRRLYDIANILSALQLIQKTQKWNGEMAYQWLISEITYLHIFNSTKSSEERSTPSRKRDISLYKEYHGEEDLKPKIPRNNETSIFCHHTNSSPVVSRDHEVKSVNEEEHNLRGQADSKSNEGNQPKTIRDCHINATQQARDVDSLGHFAYAYVPNWFSASNIFSDSQLRNSLAEFQQNVIQQWYQWFEHFPRKNKIESGEASSSAPTGHELSEVASYNNFLPIPLYLPLCPFPQLTMEASSSVQESTSATSTRDDNVVKEDEDGQR